MRLLKQIQSVLLRGRQAALQALIRSEIAERKVKNAKEARASLAELIDKISNTTLEPLSRFEEVFAYGQISSEQWNNLQKDIFIDMYSIYADLEKIRNVSNISFAANLGDFNQSKAAIIKSLNEIEKYQFIKNNPQYQDIKYIDFSDSRNLTNKLPRANPDTRVRKLELNNANRVRVQNQRSGASSTKVVVKNIGGGTVNNMDQSLSPENMLDEDPKTFWAQLVLSDSRIQHTYSPSSDAGLGSNYVSNGAIGEIDIQFPKTNKVNNVSILPFAPYPVRIIDLAYKQNPADSQWKTIKGFRVQEPTLDWYEISFRPVAMSNILVVLEQENFEENIYHIPSNLLNNQMLWSQVAQQEYDSSIFDFKLDDLNYGVIKAEPEKLAFLNAAHMVAEEIKQASLQKHYNKDEYKNISFFLEAMSEVLHNISAGPQITLGSLIGQRPPTDPNMPKTTEIKKYEYMYGIRSIDVSMIKYSPVSFYESPSFESNATITEVGLEAEETHSKFNDGYNEYKRTSVEYEVEFSNGTRLPILPESTSKIATQTGTIGYRVEDERIFVSRITNQGFTRFKAISTLCTVRRNGVRIPMTDYTFEISGEKGKITVINKYDANAVYTISYNVGLDAAKIDLQALFDSKEYFNGETFSETNSNNAIKLSYYPYTEYEIINSTSSWTKIEGESAKWLFEPTKPNYRSATISVTSGSTQVTGNFTEFTSNNNVDMSAGITNYLRVKGDTDVYQIESITDNTSITLASAYNGTSNLTSEYQISQSYYVDGQYYRFEDMTYEPTRVFVNDIKAFNLTDFERLENPAFVDDNPVGLEYQYIQAGPFIYFSKPIKQSNIKVFYRWLTQYVKLNVTLRCNVNVSTNITPKVDNIKVKIKNTRL